MAAVQAHPPEVTLRLIVAAFALLQVAIVCLAANGPFFDEGLFAVAGLRVLEGKAAEDAYITWFNGSPFVWPVLAAVGHHVAGVPGARLVAVAFATIALAAFAKTAQALFGESAARWATISLAVNGLFAALAHFAVYDLPALAATAVSMMCITRFSTSGRWRWLFAAAVAFALAVVSKYGYALMAVPLAGLLVGVCADHRARALAVFLGVAGGLVTAYFWLSFGALLPASMAVYLEQRLGRSRAHIGALQAVFAAAPLVLAALGARIAWREGRRVLVVTCLAALAVFPVFHLWTANFVSGQKHVVAGFLFAYLLAGVAVDRVVRTSSRGTVTAMLAALALWGGIQWYWQEYSWTDTRGLASHLAAHMQRGERVVAESSWVYALDLYPKGLIGAPTDVIDAHHSPDLDRLDPCAVPWMIGDAASTPRIGAAVARCGHRRVLGATTYHYQLDLARGRLSSRLASVELFRLR